MNKRRDLERQIHGLNEIKEIMNAMKNLALMETHRLSHFLDTQRRAVTTIECAAADFLHFYPQLFPQLEESREVRLLVGSERGFCGDFNESLLRALDQSGSAGVGPLVVIGAKLAAKLADDHRVTAVLDGASVVEDVEPVLVKLMETLSGLHLPGALRLTAFHQGVDPETTKVSVLQPFKRKEPGSVTFAYPPLLNLEPQPFLVALVEQYLFAALHELLYSSLMAENQRRMQHMDSAVRHLERTSAELLQRHNILHQEEITEEIEVIMLSVEALR